MKQRNVTYNYSALQDLMNSHSLTISVLAQKISISPESLTKKLNSQSEFTQDEIRKIVSLLRIPPEKITLYFFTIL
ncbi:DUF739 domain-containing protein [Megasphaera elsdenii]|uniref:HTH cro/C1-type domain-containing protein n=3 Tax=Megasphaera elsdenii TaxID=907 RepID=G0VPY5_MEGEL|nr:putative uncharacterized protein [Megasphaera elsdenii DSM 20460]SFI39366.1 Protein of unknown function [Megasphaera elsdenii]